MGITISNDHSAWLPWFAAVGFRMFGADVKNLWFAQVVISLLKIRMKLGVIINNLGNRWGMLNFSINKKEKNQDLDRSLLNEGKNHGKAKKMQSLSFKSKMIPLII